ncbi:amino acid/amide ABC transporter substrate-binding protein, HAAT family [Ruegeria halocynthiae]|uniref:Amino acid/amide ABC transporter substrate-binding protein, HAAT family n=1 Tax=Ruegeria halocynthiae TaxID=985054 RepID=A0A1H2Z5M4_9RHOB|nr:penicillin-binding protein activator [Ruegeria halocynthiae]SDX12298.1 amino acid/amide ABC transporter substrate-binding protein, HAAT family [Ruegeria halocynthiae]
MFTVCKPTRKLAKSAIVLATAAFLAACEVGGIGGGPSIDTSDPVPVALLVPSGSAQSGDAALARSLENAARLAIADLPNVKIDLRVYDTAGNAGTASAVAQQAVADGAKIILGPVYAQAANAAGLAVLSKNVNVLSFSNNTSIAGGNVYVLGPTFQNTADRLVNYSGRQGKAGTVIVHSNDSAGQLGQSAIATALSNSRVNNAGTVGYERSQQGVIDSVPAIKATVDSTGADSIFLTATTAGALPLYSQLLPEAGVSPATTQYIGLTRWDIPAQTLELPGVQGGWFALPDPAKAQAYRQRYNNTYGAAPHPISGLAYDGIAAIGALVSQGKSNALTGAALTQNAGFQGVGGIFRLRPNGTNERGLAVATIQNKQVVVIDPAPQSFSGAGF